MSKSYDRVDWGFLNEMLLKLGFNQRMVSLFMAYVTSAKYNIRHAGREFGCIVSGRGIRQGDPLSSYLFLICMEGFTSLIKEFERRNLIQGVQIARGTPRLSHMFFADDSYIYCKVNGDASSQVINMLYTFEKASGQKINMEKSSVFFSCNTETQGREEICSSCNFRNQMTILHI